MSIAARYVHTNLVARDWPSLAAFYRDIFGCQAVPPTRDLSGPAMDAGTGIPGVRITGSHLRLPGWGEGGPTLEVFQYNDLANSPAATINRPGYGHIAFEVADVDEARQQVLAAGGRPIGEIVTVQIAGGRQVTWCYVTDPEGNAIELQSWSK